MAEWSAKGINPASVQVRTLMITRVTILGVSRTFCHTSDRLYFYVAAAYWFLSFFI
jgi:hypothetical protein